MNDLNDRPNFCLREEIKDYWGRRAETFDDQPGHEIFSPQERVAWHQLLLAHLGPGHNKKALDLACGTGVMTRLLSELDYTVTGLEWAEPMLERAMTKASAHPTLRHIRFLLADAEHTMEPSNSYDALTCRHLVWTLVDPPAAFREWFRLLRPGGTLLIVDGDFVTPGPVGRFLKILARPLQWLQASRRPSNSTGIAETPAPQETLAQVNRRILEQVYFSGGARACAVAELLKLCGFTQIRIDTKLGAIHKAQAANFSLAKSLDRATQHRYAISARKPL